MEHIDWFSRKWRHGTTGLNGYHRAVYFEIINDTYLLGDYPIEDFATLAALLQWRPSKIKRVVEELIAMGKLHRETHDGTVRWVANGCTEELSRAESRMERSRRNGAKGGRKPRAASGPNVQNSSKSGQNLSVSCQNLSETCPKLDTSDEENQSLKEPSGFATKQNNTINPLSPFQKMCEGGEPSLDSEAQNPEFPAPDQPALPDCGAPGEPSPADEPVTRSSPQPEAGDCEAPGNTRPAAALEPPPARSSPRANGTNPRALGTNPRALGTNPKALGQGPPLPALELPDGPEPVPQMFRAVLREFGEAAYRSWIAPLAVQSVNGTVVLGAPDRVTRDWINRRYGDAMRRAAGVPVEVVWTGDG